MAEETDTAVLLLRWRDTVNRLSNWQRNKWARAGYPGLQKKDTSKLEPFLAIKR